MISKGAFFMATIVEITERVKSLSEDKLFDILVDYQITSFMYLDLFDCVHKTSDILTVLSDYSPFEIDQMISEGHFRNEDKYFWFERNARGDKLISGNLTTFIDGNYEFLADYTMFCERYDLLA